MLEYSHKFIYLIPVNSIQVNRFKLKKFGSHSDSVTERRKSKWNKFLFVSSKIKLLWLVGSCSLLVFNVNSLGEIGVLHEVSGMIVAVLGGKNCIKYHKKD